MLGSKPTIRNQQHRISPLLGPSLIPDQPTQRLRFFEEPIPNQALACELARKEATHNGIKNIYFSAQRLKADGTFDGTLSSC